MNTQTNINLLKEYIKTLVATDVEFPGIVARCWGNEFSRAELEAIHFTLKFVLKSAAPHTRESLLKAFKNVNHPGVNMHWFLCDFWEEIVPLLTKYHSTGVQYPKAEKPKTMQGLDLALFALMNDPNPADWWEEK